MLSVSGKNWKEISISKRIIDKVKHDHDFSDILSKIIVARKYSNLEINSLNNDIEISNPLINFKDFNLGHTLIKETIKYKDKILIIGDYDVDGCISTSLFVNFFKLLRKEVEYYIPDRFLDGYGASLKLIKRLVKKKPKLVIMLDCGSNSFETVNYLNSKKIKSIIIDHHEIHKPYPKTKCLINPKKECDYNEFDYFCTSTLAYFFINSFFDNKILKRNLKKI